MSFIDFYNKFVSLGLTKLILQPQILTILLTSGL